jgi:hypothetical protein
MPHFLKLDGIKTVGSHKAQRRVNGEQIAPEEKVLMHRRMHLKIKLLKEGAKIECFYFYIEEPKSYPFPSLEDFSPIMTQTHFFPFPDCTLQSQ